MKLNNTQEKKEKNNKSIDLLQVFLQYCPNLGTHVFISTEEIRNKKFHPSSLLNKLGFKPPTVYHLTQFRKQKQKYNSTLNFHDDLIYKINTL